MKTISMVIGGIAVAATGYIVFIRKNADVITLFKKWTTKAPVSGSANPPKKDPSSTQTPILDVTTPPVGMIQPPVVQQTASGTTTSTTPQSNTQSQGRPSQPPPRNMSVRFNQAAQTTKQTSNAS